MLVLASLHRIRPDEPQTTRTRAFAATATTRLQIHASGEIGSGVLFTGLTPPDGSDRVLGRDDRSWAYFGAPDAREYALVARLEGTSVQSSFFYIGSASAYLLNDDFLRLIGAMDLRDQPVVLRLVVNRPNLDNPAAGDNEWVVNVQVTQDELPRATFMLTVTPRPPQAFATPDFYYELGTRIRVSARGLISTGVTGTGGTPPSGWAGAGAGLAGGEVGAGWRDWPLRGPGIRRYCLVGRIAGEGYSFDLEVFGSFREKVGDGRVTGLHRLVLGMLRPNFDSPDTAGSGAWNVLVEVFDPPRPPPAAMRPSLAIANVEIVQSVQHADNTVPLVAGKRTLVRAFVDSGLRGADIGYGWNLVNHVTGRLRITGPGAAPPLDLLPNFDANEIAARLPLDMRRDDLSHSLNFLLPLERSSGVVTCDVSVFAEGHEADPLPGWRASQMQSISFLPGRRRNILPLLVAHAGHSERPTMAQFLTMLAGATRRFPVPENFFVVLPPRTLDLAAEIDLSRSDDDWSRAVAAVRALQDATPTIIAGIVFKPNGTGTSLIGVCRGRSILLSAHDGPAWAEQFSSAEGEQTMSHELGHTFGLNHAHGCVDDDIDPRLPIDGRTDEIGIDTVRRQAQRRGISETMSYCGVPDWLSTAAYRISLG